jgi:probable F420-dependent oxidoreductase
MKLGICLPHYGKAMEPGGMRAFAEAAERLGFDSLWVTDHLIVPKARDMLYKERMLDSLSTLSFLAGVTSRIRIGTSVIVLPYRHPVQVAKAIATADVLSGGRVTFGAGVGALEGEFRALNANFEERGDVADEYLRVIRSLWTDPTAPFEGKYVTLKEMFFSPESIQKPHPPIWIGGSTKRAGRRAVELGDAWHGTNVTVDQFVEISTHMRMLSEKRGRAEPPGVNVRMPVYFDQPLPEGRIGLNGSSEDVAEQAQAYIDTGAEEMVFGLPDLSFEEAMNQMSRLSSDVNPKLRTA